MINKQIKFGIDARCLEWQRGGVSRILLSLLEQWLGYDDKIHYYLYFQNFIPEDIILKNIKITNTIINGPNILKKRRILAEQLLLPFTISKDSLDIFFSPWYTAPLLLSSRIKLFVGAWDISYSTNPRHYSFLNRISLGYFSKIACKKAFGIVTCSSFDARQIVKYYNIDASKIKILQLSANAQFNIKATKENIYSVTNKYGIEKNFLLSLGVIYNRRNIDVIIESFKIIHTKFPHKKLVIVGSNHTNPKIDINKLIANNSNIKHIEWVDDNELPIIYQMAEAYICTSTVDGESIMLKEATLSNTPVITSPLLVDSIGGHCFVISDPENINSTIETLLDFYNKEISFKNSQVAKAHEFLKINSWENSSHSVYSFITNINV